MRLFLAIDLPKEMKEYLFELEKKFKEVKVTWVAKKNLHITLKFLGEVEEKKLENLKKLISIKQKPLLLHLSQIDFFPNIKSPRVIWGAIEPKEEVIRLQQHLDEQLLHLFPGEQKFEAHITLGRIKSIRRKEDFYNSIKRIKLEQKNFQIDSFQIMRSELKKNGPTYKIIENIALSEM